jgi:hypothetical protein
MMEMPRSLTSRDGEFMKLAKGQQFTQASPPRKGS